MKTNGRIAELIRRRVRNERDYLHQVVWPLLDELGFPPAGNARWPEFATRNPTGDDMTSSWGILPETSSTRERTRVM